MIPAGAIITCEFHAGRTGAPEAVRVRRQEPNVTAYGVVAAGIRYWPLLGRVLDVDS